jgi:hypothetical protein
MTLLTQVLYLQDKMGFPHVENMIRIWSWRNYLGHMPAKRGG